MYEGDFSRRRDIAHHFLLLVDFQKFPLEYTQLIWVSPTQLVLNAVKNKRNWNHTMKPKLKYQLHKERFEKNILDFSGVILDLQLISLYSYEIKNG